jgi:hypothetical protein
MIRCFLSTFFRDNAAAAAAEMALILPMAFALLFTTFEGGHYMWTEHKVVKGVRDGARYAGRLPFDHFSCGSSTLVNSADASAPTATTRETQIKNLTRTGQISGGTAKVKNWADADITITVACNPTYNAGIYTNISGGAPHVVVSTVVEYPAILGLLGFDTSGVIVRAQANAPVTGL